MNNEKNDQAPGQNKEYTINVNGKMKLVTTKKITYQEVIVLAFGSDALTGNFNYTVLYSKGESDNIKGSLAEGQSVPVKDEMIFNVKRTIRS